jgi:hypothetical protein
MQLACVDQDRRSSDELQWQARREHVAATIQELAKEYDAITQWDSDLPSRSYLEPYTIHLQDRLVQDRPVLLRVQLTDVMRTPRGPVAVFSPFFPASDTPLHLRLTVPDDLLVPLLSSDSSSFLPELAVVAAISSVGRPIIALTAKSYLDDPNMAHVEPEVADWFVAEGQLLGFRVLWE